MRPVAYIDTFRRLSVAIRARTNITAMLWSPNSGQNYPFSGGGQRRPSDEFLPEDFLALDTDGNGRINSGDGTCYLEIISLSDV
jgi:hypothetical protein